MNVYTAEQVAQHHTTHSLWVIVDDKAFLFDHPGGEEMILQHGGLDISDLLRSDREHVHSDTAFEMLESYCIGTLSKETTDTLPKTKMADSAVDLRKSVDFIDLEKPMFSQVLHGTFDRDFYIQQVHIPRHTKQSAPIFGHALLEPLTKTYWWVIPLFWAPVVYFAFTRSLQSLSWPFAAALFVVGLANWTLIEYTLHRALFHMDYMLPNNRYAITLHFMTHGVHHFLPMDKMRLVMPPALGVILSWPIWTAHVLLLPVGYGDAIIAGSYVGFVMYDLIHYYSHHGKPFGSYLKEVKSYHLDHHYKNSNLGYGVTSKFWDQVFGTLL